MSSAIECVKNPSSRPSNWLKHSTSFHQKPLVWQGASWSNDDGRQNAFFQIINRKKFRFGVFKNFKKPLLDQLFIFIVNFNSNEQYNQALSLILLKKKINLTSINWLVALFWSCIVIIFDINRLTEVLQWNTSWCCLRSHSFGA